MDYLNPLGNNLVYCLAVEKLLELEVPKRAQYIRVMMVELQRISSHLVWLGTHALDMGAMSVMLYCFREREEILKIFERFAGQRMMTSYIRIGGVALEPPAGWRTMVKNFLDIMPARIDEYEALLTENRIWQGRLKGVGYLPAEQLIALSTTGPGLRAAGINLDNRKAFPYSSYEEFDFEVPIRTESDCFARYLVRVAEIRESVKIVRQAMDKITDTGVFKAEAPGIIPPAREKMKTEMEALIYHFKIFTEGFFAETRRSLRRRGIAARRTRLLCRQRRLAKAAACTLPFALLREFAGAALHGEGSVDRRRRRQHRDDRYRSGRRGQIALWNFHQNSPRNSTSCRPAIRSGVAR